MMNGGSVLAPHSLYRPYLALEGPLAGGGYPGIPIPVRRPSWAK
jgi:hypothetical protein